MASSCEFLPSLGHSPGNNPLLLRKQPAVRRVQEGFCDLYLTGEDLLDHRDAGPEWPALPIGHGYTLAATDGTYVTVAAMHSGSPVDSPWGQSSVTDGCEASRRSPQAVSILARRRGLGVWIAVADSRDSAAGRGPYSF